MPNTMGFIDDSVDVKLTAPVDSIFWYISLETATLLERRFILADN